jgi:DNA polymerase V
MSCIIIPPSELNLRPIRSKIKRIPLVSSKVAAGFPSPADDHLETTLDVNELLIEQPAATFFVRVSGESMQGEGIFENDILAVNRAKTPVNGCVVVAAVNGDCLVKYYRKQGQRTWLQSAHPSFPDIELGDNMDVEIWGVVRGIVTVYGRDGRRVRSN